MEPESRECWAVVAVGCCGDHAAAEPAADPGLGGCGVGCSASAQVTCTTATMCLPVVSRHREPCASEPCAFDMSQLCSCQETSPSGPSVLRKSQAVCSASIEDARKACALSKHRGGLKGNLLWNSSGIGLCRKPAAMLTTCAAHDQSSQACAQSIRQKGRFHRAHCVSAVMKQVRRDKNVLVPAAMTGSCVSAYSRCPVIRQPRRRPAVTATTCAATRGRMLRCCKAHPQVRTQMDTTSGVSDPASILSEGPCVAVLPIVRM